MKKTLLSVLFASLSVMFVAGCGDGTKDEPAPFTGGTYAVEFFGSQVTNPRLNFDDPSGLILGFADMFYISNNCAQAETLYPDIVNAAPGKNACVASEILDDNSQVTLLKGIVAIEVKADGKAYITSKMEMKDGAVKLSELDKYQYTEYSPVDVNNTQLAGTGVKGWNYNATDNTPSAAAIESLNSPFTVKIDGNKIDINMTLKDKLVLDGKLTVDAVTRVIATRTGDFVALTNDVDVDLTVPTN